MFGLHTYFTPILHFYQCRNDFFKFQLNYWQKMIYIQGAGMIVRAKYYGAWKISEASCSMTKISYNGTDKNGNPLFDRGENVKILGVEIGENPKMLTDSWNKV
jgi:lysophospholipid acyltransferase